MSQKPKFRCGFRTDPKSASVGHYRRFPKWLAI